MILKVAHETDWDLVEMQSKDQIQVEFVTGGPKEVSGFTVAAKTYVR